jgi:hypothetical protein
MPSQRFAPAKARQRFPGSVARHRDARELLAHLLLDRFASLANVRIHVHALGSPAA